MLSPRAAYAWRSRVSTRMLLLSRVIAVGLIALAISAGVNQPASAADIGSGKGTDAMAQAPRAPLLPIYNWTGCYIGGNMGVAFGRGQISDSTGAGISGTNSGFAGGGQVGCDYQFGGGFVIGARGMFDWTKLKGSGTFTSGPNAGSVGNTQTTSFSTLTVRLGYAVMPTGLIYLQTGGAWSRSDYDIFTGRVKTAQGSNNKGGYDFGIGYEQMISPNWSAFLEYNYMNFGTATGTIATGPVSLKKDSQNILLGVNWRFR
jgi:outer membrane immunogenic protein